MSDGFQSVHPGGVATVSDSRRAALGAAGSGDSDEPSSHEAGVQEESAPRLANARRIEPRVDASEPELPRWRDARAELPALRAELERAERERDVERERLIAAALARALAKRRAELDIAVRLGRRAVLLGEEGLRTELAAWHCQLGQTDVAVGLLVPLLESPGLDRARLSMRIALYWARLGEADNALAALREAAAYDPADPLIHELQATVHGWAPRAARANEAAAAYLRGAARRRQRRDEHGAFQDTLRAFDIAPDSSEAAQALASAVGRRRSPVLEDEVWRRHSRALVARGREDEARAVDLARVQRLLRDGQLEAALAAAFDAGLDATIDAEALLAVVDAGGAEQSAPPQPASVFDWLLVKLGVLELTMARLELAAEAASTPSAKSRCYRILGELLERETGSTERALDPWIAAVVADPSSEAARATLQRHAATTGDQLPLMEALIRVGGEPRPSDVPGTLACLRELQKLAESRLDDAALGFWCVERALRLEPESAEWQAAHAALGPGAARAQRALAEANAELDRAGAEERVSWLRQLAGLLRGRPDHVEQYASVLWELASRRPKELRWRRLLETVLTRADDSEALSRLWTRDLVSRQDSGVGLRALLGLARLERQAGNLQGSLAVLAADDHRGSTAAAALQLALAAQLGKHRLRAEALLELGASLPAALRAWLASVASSELAARGELTLALEAAEVGTRADPNLPRPMVAYADAAEGRQDRVAAVAYERAMALTFPSSAHCRGLIAALEALGESFAAQVWTGRWLGLRPAETAAAVQLLRGAAELGDAARLGDVVTWTVSQAHPTSLWAEPLGLALTRLAEVDRTRASEVAWRVLDAFGPKPIALRHAVLAVAEQSGDRELEVAVIERELAVGSDAGEAQLWRLITLHSERGEVDRAYAVMVRALAAGLDAERVLAELDAHPKPQTPEGEFHRLQARALALERIGRDPLACRRALREYGAALWDLARDPARALEVWLRAAELGGAPGWFQFARDLVEVQGLERALDQVCRLAESRESPDQVAALLTGAAVVSKNGGNRRRALQLGLLALDTDPLNVWALEIIESAALLEDVPAVERAYRAALGATLGRFGERALHYRAARFFERIGDQSLALTHAILAFRAVPSEGVTFALVQRLAQGSKDAERASRALEEVAASYEEGRARSEWLRRAALLAGRSAEGAQQRMEVLLRALLSSPDAQIVDLLGRAFTDLARQQPEERGIGQLRFARAVAKVIPRLESVEGARVATAMAGVALRCFSDHRLALEALEGAAALDPLIEEFGEFVADAGKLAADPAVARAWLRAIDERTSGGERAGAALLELAGELASVVGEPALAASFLARRMACGDELEGAQSRLEQLLERSREVTLPPHVHALAPSRARHAECLARAEQAARDGDRAAELAALRAAFELEPALPSELCARLLELATEASNVALAEQVLAQIRAADPDSLARATLRVSSLLVEQRRPERALELLRQASERAPEDTALLARALDAARAAGDEAQRQELLDRLIELTSDLQKKTQWLDEAWELAKARGDAARAEAILRRWLEADPDDLQALSRLEAECEARGAWAELADLLARHLALGVSFRERRRLVLWRSELLEKQLGRLAEARQELALLIEQGPADRVVVERLAQVTEALGDMLGAAESWLTASGLSSTRPVAAELAERACRLFLDRGELLSARRVLAAPQTLPRTLGLARLAVRLEREGENEPRLARALEELAAVDDQPEAERGQASLEAARLWRRLGDYERASQAATVAARLCPEDLEAQLLTTELEYRRGALRAREAAQGAVERLRRVVKGVSGESADLVAFLLAEALDAVHADAPALAELHAARERLGPTPLVAVALAERLARGPNPSEAFAHYDIALGGGDLRGLRKPSEVAFAAAKLARRLGQNALVQRYAKLAEVDPELGEVVSAWLAQSTPKPPSGVAPPAEVRPAEPSTFRAKTDRPREAEADTRPARRTQIGIGAVAAPPASPSGAAAPRGLVASVTRGLEVAAPRVRERVRLVHDLPKRPFSVAKELPSPRGFEPASPEEKALWERLQRGARDAGQELVERLVREPRRLEDLRAVCLGRLRLEPGSMGPLEDLAAVADALGDSVHLAALSHVKARAGEPHGAPQVPRLEAQLERPEPLRQLLFREADGNWPQALEVIWESTRRVLEWESVRDIKSAERLRPESPSPVARCHFEVARLLGLPATPLLQLPAQGEPRASVIMLGEPSVLVRGEATSESAVLRYELGAALSGTLPAFAIINAATYEQIEDLFRAVYSAFGPPETSQTNFTSTARLAALLWESVPPRTQRQMTEWCKEGKITRELAVLSARRAARRSGLFAAGDLAVGLGRVIADEGIDPSLLRASDGLERLCSRSSAAADLVRLACEPTYAHLRWRPESERALQGFTRRGI